MSVCPQTSTCQYKTKYEYKQELAKYNDFQAGSIPGLGTSGPTALPAQQKCQLRKQEETTEVSGGNRC